MFRGSTQGPSPAAFPDKGSPWLCRCTATLESNQGGCTRGVSAERLETPLVGGAARFWRRGGNPPAPAFPHRGKRERGESNQTPCCRRQLPTGSCLNPPSRLSRRNSLEPLEAGHSHFLKRVKPASLGGTNGRTQSGPLMLNYPSKTDLHYIFLLTT